MGGSGLLQSILKTGNACCHDYFVNKHDGSATEGGPYHMHRHLRGLLSVANNFKNPPYHMNLRCPSNELPGTAALPVGGEPGSTRVPSRTPSVAPDEKCGRGVDHRSVIEAHASHAVAKTAPKAFLPAKIHRGVPASAKKKNHASLRQSFRLTPKSRISASNTSTSSARCTFTR